MNRLIVVAALVGVILMVSASPAGALCAPRSQQQHFAAADVVFEGIARDGVQAPRYPTLLSPATFDVVTYLKGEGPTRVQVTTAVRRSGNGFVVLGDGIMPEPGELWRIYGRPDAGEIIESSQCDGSRLLSDTAGRTVPPPPDPSGVPLALVAAIAGAAALATGALFAIRSARRSTV